MNNDCPVIAQDSQDATSFSLNDLEALLTVAQEAREWIAAHVLKR